MSKNQTIPPRGLNIRQASAYWGVSAGTFKKMERLGLVPPPLNLPGLDRKIFDKQMLDQAMDAARSADGVGGIYSAVDKETALATSWDDV
jgi:hypothetical protein